MKIDKLIKTNMMVFIMSMTVNVLGAVFQVLAGAIVGDAMVFSDLNAMFSLHAILTIPLGTITYIVTKYVAEFKSVQKYGEIKGSIPKLVWVNFIIGIAVCLVTVIFAESIAVFFNISNINYIKLEAFLAGFTICEAFFSGVFQGMQYFVLYNVFGVCSQFMKIVGLFLCTVSVRKIEIIWGVMIFGVIVMLIWAWLKTKKIFMPYCCEQGSYPFNRIVKFSIVVILVNAITTVQSNIDLLLVKHYFNYDSGDYSIVMVLAKCITYFAGAFVVVLFPFTVAMKNNMKSALALLKRTMLLTSTLELIAMLGFLAFGEQIIRIMYGNTFQSIDILMLPVVTMIVPIGLITLLTNFLLAMEYYKALLVGLVISITAQIAIVNCWHDRLEHLIYGLALVLWGTLIGLTIFICRIAKSVKLVGEK